MNGELLVTNPAKMRNLFLAAGIAAFVALGIGATSDHGRHQFYHSYLVAFIYWFHFGLGALAFLMIQYLTGGAWGLMGRRVFEAASRTLPLLVVLFLPIVVGMHSLYEWSHAEVVAKDPVLQQKVAYLNPKGFLIRTAIYFALWVLVGFLLARWSAKQDRALEPGAMSQRCATLSGPGLVIYGLSATFASVDWLMSLEPHWYSTIYGALFVVGELCGALAFTIVVLVWLGKGPLSSVLGKRHYHDFGKLLLAFVMLWAYISFSQFLIIWSGNLAEEVTFYVKRLEGAWQYVALALIIAHFALPFLLLLSRDLKRNPSTLVLVALLVLGMRYVDLFYLIRPASPHREFAGFSWMDLAAFVAVGGIWCAAFLFNLSKRSLLPVNDLRLKEAIEHGKH
ncbi:MAG: hypothetical protein D6691_06595 [Candidatus Hydrogenedentota bacterium]|jgi:hypothetical protein|uniref:Alternative complex III subunit ActF n=1 Tax=Sumerlaea chitinivorans TaxID=2250252 RepID=A0A2Z4Y2E9_SUMC1|nr:alternative complex III subunit ActF [Candidatus Sumerlaea chitinivorans]RMH27251.1 MAG: hypothetical protein D6691_06595 [Candidatus Hydrogenedentota bacterium]